MCPSDGQQTIKVDDKTNEVLKDLPAKKRSEILSLLFERTEICRYQGPIPSPDDIALYNQHIPDGANRIMKMAEEQSSHRRELETIVIRSQQRQSERGQLFGFSLGILGLSLAAYLGISGHEAIGSVIGGSTVISLVSVFVIGKQLQRNDLKTKKDPTQTK